MALCHGLLAKTPARGRYVVWIAFDHAGPGNTARKDIGPVSFWDCDWGRGNLMQGGPHLDDIPGELTGTGGIFSPGNLPSGRDVRLARVALVCHRGRSAGAIIGPRPARAAVISSGGGP
jgi:hypothetical protein